MSRGTPGQRATQVAVPEASCRSAYNPSRSCTIDGGQHPELIPDEVAFRLFMRSIAVREADPLIHRRSRFRLQRAGFRLDEVEALLAVASEYVGRAGALQNGSSKGRPAELKELRWPLGDSTGH